MPSQSIAVKRDVHITVVIRYYRSNRRKKNILKRNAVTILIYH